MIVLKLLFMIVQHSVTYQFAEHAVNANNSQASRRWNLYIMKKMIILQLQAATSNHFEGTVAILETNREDL